MANAPDLAAARAGLELLLADARPDSPVELRDKIIELAKILRPSYRNGGWETLTGTIREKFGLDVPAPEPVIPDVPVPFQTPDRFEDIVEEGFLLDYLTYTQESEAPTQFHFGAMLTCASAAFGRRPLIGWDAVPLYTNIYTLLVGPTGTKKSTALSKARDLVVMAFPKRGSTPAQINILPNEGSPQGYAAALRRRNFEVSTISDGLIIASELKVLVGKDQYKAALGEWLTDWYDNMSNPWTRALKGEDVYELPAPYVCFASASNMTWLKEIPENLIKAGFLPRHLVFTANDKRHDKASPRFDDVLRARLADRLAANVSKLPEKLPLSKDADLWLDAWYMAKVTRQERTEQDELFAAWLSRKVSHALKVAVVWQIIDGGPRTELHVDWLRRATRLVDWMDAGVLTVYHTLGSTSEGAVTEAVLSYIERKGGEISLALLGRGLKNRYNSRSVLEGVRTLILARVVTQDASDIAKGTMIRLTGRGAANG